MATLCAPERNLSCFGCCPPIRPAHYDPLDFAGSLRREFAENRAAFLRSPLRARPIVGYHCWALGFLDTKGETAGCLLHPARNQGRDLRGLVDYGDKCRRESCVAAREFDLLPARGREFWLPLVRGLNPFYYSSPRANPLFHIMPWGAGLLERLRDFAALRGWSCTEIIHSFPFLVRREWKPRAHRYVFGLLVELLEARDDVGEVVEATARRALAQIPGLEAVRELEASEPDVESIWTHQGHEPMDFQDFVRLELGMRKTDTERLQRARRAVESLIRRESGFETPNEEKEKR
mgnify:CR=1 FL=1